MNTHWQCQRGLSGIHGHSMLEPPCMPADIAGCIIGVTTLACSPLSSEVRLPQDLPYSEFLRLTDGSAGLNDHIVPYCALLLLIVCLEPLRMPDALLVQVVGHEVSTAMTAVFVDFVETTLPCEFAVCQ